MPVFPVSHFQWQILRAVKRTKKPTAGRDLRLAPTRATKDGSFLTRLVNLGLLARATGTEKEPFGATYTLTELGQHAAEYGEADFPTEAIPALLPGATSGKSKRSRSKT